MLKCFPLPHHKRMTTTSHCFLFWQYVIHLIQLTCWKAKGSTQQARDDKWGAESLLAVVHPWCLPGSETQGSRYEWGDLPCGRQEGRGHQHGTSTPGQLQNTALPDCFPSYSASESSNLTPLRQHPLSSRDTQKKTDFPCAVFQFSICPLW